MNISAINTNLYKARNQQNIFKRNNFNGIIVCSKNTHEYYYYPFIDEDRLEITENIRNFKENYQDEEVDIVRIANPILATAEKCDKRTIDKIAENSTIIYNPAKSIE